MEAVTAEADAAAAPEEAQSPAERLVRSGKQARSGGGKQRKRSAAERQGQQEEEEQEPESAQQQVQPPAAKQPRSKSSGKSAGAAPLGAPAASQRSQREVAQPAGEQAGPSAAAPAAPQPSAAEQVAGGAEVLAQAARAAGAAVQGQALAASVPAQDHCERCQHFSDNFAALLVSVGGWQPGGACARLVACLLAVPWSHGAG